MGLYKAWYEGQGIGKFRTIDDSKEWEGMDKLGHVFTAYMYADAANQGLAWTGMRRPRRLLLAAGTSLLLQSTIEVMDGFSTGWGFSWYDMGANTLGVATFIGQEAAFGEQRFRFKFSASGVRHSTQPLPSFPEGGPTSTLADRAAQLYGSSPWTRFVKDYAGQTIWISANPGVLVGRGETAKLPWLNLALGYSPNNVYGAYANNWHDGYGYNGNQIAVRSHDLVLGLDIDFSRIPVKNRTIRTLLFFANFIKVPSPAVIRNNRQGIRWEWLYF